MNVTVIRHLGTVTAVELYVLTGLNAVAGFPLPDGLLPVGTGEGMAFISPEEWREYRRTCDVTRAAAECSFWPPAERSNLEAAA